MNIKSCPVESSKEIHIVGKTFTFRHHPRLLNNFLDDMLRKHNGFLAGSFAVYHFRELANAKLEWRPNDIDVYFRTEEDFNSGVEQVKKMLGISDTTSLETKPYMGESIRALTFNLGGMAIQLIKAMFGPIEEILGTFDFTNSKCAISINADGQPIFTYEEELPRLLSGEMVKYRRQTNLKFETEEERKVYATANLKRLEKYFDRFPKGFVDETSREHVIHQYAWDLNYQTQYSRWSLGHLVSMLAEGDLEELILFYPLGGDWKKAFDTKGESLKSSGNNVWHHKIAVVDIPF